MVESSELLLRSQLLLGPETMQKMSQTRVIIFGVGGVGSWCAESLVRTGITHLTIVDSDVVCASNVNRQLMATSLTIGRPKVEVLRQRLQEINPHAQITALQKVYNSQTSAEFCLQDYDYVIDAIDSLADKAHLILTATSIPTLRLFCSMGAALRMDPLCIRKAEFWKVRNDALARALRNKFKKDKTFPSRKFQCVYSEEPAMSNRGDVVCDEANPGKSRINGSLSLVTAPFGFTLASLVIFDLIHNS